MGYADLGCMGARTSARRTSTGWPRKGFGSPISTPTPRSARRRGAAFITGRWQQRVGLEWAMGFTAEQ